MRLLVGALILLLALPVSAFDLFSDKKKESSPEPSQGGQSLEQRVQMLERRINTISNIVLRLDSLQQEMQQLRGDMEVQNHELEGLKKRQTDLYTDMDQRMSRVTGETPAGLPADTAGGAPPPEAASGTPPQAQTQMSAPSGEPNWESTPLPSGSGQSAGMAQGQRPVAPAAGAVRQQSAESNLPPVVSSTSTPASPQVTDGPGQLQTSAVVMAPSQQSAPYHEAEGEKASYQQAFNLLMDRKYDQAEQAFRGFLAKYPGSRLADNAQYWLAEANYVTRNFDVAQTEFSKVIKLHPNSPKVSDALLKIGYIQYEKKQWAAAKDTLSVVMNRYPNTTASQLAQKRLDQLRAQGR